MSNIVKCKKHYFVWTVLLLFIEIMIALFAHDKIVRPYAGDFLAVILVYCFARSFISASVKATALFALIVSYAVEILQYFNIAGRLGLQNSKLAKIVLGTSFEWIDLIMYTSGIILVLYLEKVISGIVKQPSFPTENNCCGKCKLYNSMTLSALA